MIEIRHKESGEILHRVDADTLEDAVLSGLRLAGADLSGLNLTHADFRNTDAVG